MVRAYRVTINSRCVLGFRNNRYPVVLENISADGALVILEKSSRLKLKKGELCNLMLGEMVDFFTPQSMCRVSRVDIHNKLAVAVQFLEPLERFWDTVPTPPRNHQQRLLAISGQ